jgi:hypothetical protein
MGPRGRSSAVKVRPRLLSHENSLALAALAGAAPAVAAAVWLSASRGAGGRAADRRGDDPRRQLSDPRPGCGARRRTRGARWRRCSNRCAWAITRCARALAGEAIHVSEALTELNLLGDALRDRRLETLEVNALLQKVLEEIDVALFAFDEASNLRLVNPAGARLLAEPAAACNGTRRRRTRTAATARGGRGGGDGMRAARRSGALARAAHDVSASPAVRTNCW